MPFMSPEIEAEILAAVIHPALEQSLAVSVLPPGAVAQRHSLAARDAEARAAIAALEAEIAYSKQHPACSDAPRPLALILTRWTHYSKLVQILIAAPTVRDALAELVALEPDAFWDAYWAALLDATGVSEPARAFLADAALWLMANIKRRPCLDALRRCQRRQGRVTAPARRAITVLFSVGRKRVGFDC